MEPLNVCINTQTPLLQFAPPEDGGPEPWEGRSDLSRMREGVDYRLSPGGVTRMVYPLAKRLISSGQWREVHWVSLNPHAPPTIRLPDGITLHNVAIDTERVSGYGKTKETIWNTVHGVTESKLAQELFWTDDYGEYAFYNRTTAELIRRLDRTEDFDAFYIHDFQQLPIGHMLGTVKPKFFRWHIPFDARKIPSAWRALVATYLDSYDVVIVSSDRYRDSLKRFGHRGEVARVYPYVDPHEYSLPDAAVSRAACERFGLSPGDTVALVVARMDPAKGQDRAIEAVARLAKRFPRLRLVLAGNGSFSSGGRGLGLSKGATWRSHLEQVAKDLGVSDRVRFTGHVTQPELEALYDRSAFTILPSTREGFGLVVVESWLYSKPTLVTRRAGVAELIRDGENGLLFDPDDPRTLDRQLLRLLRDRGPLREKLAENGRRTAELCSLENGFREESRLFSEHMGD